MVQRLQDTDAFIMMEFAAASKELAGKPVTAEIKAEFKRIATPFIQRLQRNGHSLVGAVGLLLDAFAVNSEEPAHA